MSHDEGLDVLAKLDFEPSLDPNTEQLNAANHNLYLTQATFHNACAEFREEANDDTRSALYVAVSELADTVQLNIEKIVQLVPLEHVDSALFGLLSTQDSQNIKHFQSLTSQEGLFEANQKSIWEQIMQARDESLNQDDFIQKIAQYYRGALQQDLNAFMQKSYSAYQEFLANTLRITFARLAVSDVLDPEPIVPIKDHTDVSEDESTDKEEYRVYTFSIQPPIIPHETDFMGNTVYLSHSTAQKTFGSIYVPESMIQADDTDDQENLAREYVVNTLYRYLNPLGDMSLRFSYLTVNDDLEGEADTDSSEL